MFLLKSLDKTVGQMLCIVGVFRGKYKIVADKDKCYTVTFFVSTFLSVLNVKKKQVFSPAVGKKSQSVVISSCLHKDLLIYIFDSKKPDFLFII